MHNHPSFDAALRSAQLHAIACGFVTEGLGKRNFEAIPYSNDVVVRAPLVPGQPAAPIVGREALRRQWRALFGLMSDMEVLDSFVNQDMSLVLVEFHCTLGEPRRALRIIDRFKVNAEGEIIQHEHFMAPYEVPDRDSFRP